MSALTKEEIKNTITMAELLDRYGIKHSKNKALCPFHSEHTPSFVIKGVNYRCYGCGEGGDIFTFVQQMENCDFKESLRRLGGDGDCFEYHRPKPTEAQRQAKKREHIRKEWINCLKYIEENRPPIMDVDLLTMTADEIDRLWNFSDEYVKQMHRLPYLEHLVFDGGAISGR